MAKGIIRSDLWRFLAFCINDKPTTMKEIEAAALTAEVKVHSVLVRGYLNAGITLNIVDVLPGSPVRFRRMIPIPALFDLSEELEKSIDAFVRKNQNEF